MWLLGRDLGVRVPLKGSLKKSSGSIPPARLACLYTAHQPFNKGLSFKAGPRAV